MSLYFWFGHRRVQAWGQYMGYLVAVSWHFFFSMQHQDFNLASVFRTMDYGSADVFVLVPTISVREFHTWFIFLHSKKVFCLQLYARIIIEIIKKRFLKQEKSDHFSNSLLLFVSENSLNYLKCELSLSLWNAVLSLANQRQFNCDFCFVTLTITYCNHSRLIEHWKANK